VERPGCFHRVPFKAEGKESRRRPQPRQVCQPRAAENTLMRARSSRPPAGSADRFRAGRIESPRMLESVAQREATTHPEDCPLGAQRRMRVEDLSTDTSGSSLSVWRAVGRSSYAPRCSRLASTSAPSRPTVSGTWSSITRAVYVTSRMASCLVCSYVLESTPRGIRRGPGDACRSQLNPERSRGAVPTMKVRGARQERGRTERRAANVVGGDRGQDDQAEGLGLEVPQE
jgi:hypothetical protein